MELEIHNVRGIRHLVLRPDGKNFVIWGPNGSGKSAVVDAIDFLLTGRISRLLGRGTGGITLSEHGPHIDHTAEDAKVCATLKLPALDTPVEVERCMKEPGTLKCDAAVRARLRPVQDVARRGQHLLTRRDILRYIAAEAGTRAQEIQALLNMSEPEGIRKALVSTVNKLEAERRYAKAAVDGARHAVNATTGQDTYREGRVLQFVNRERKKLGGQPVSELRPEQLKEVLLPHDALNRDEGVNIAIFKRDIDSLRSSVSRSAQLHIATQDQKLRHLMATMRKDHELHRELLRRELTQLGIPLIDDTGSCPLCDKPWPPGKLRAYLEQRLETAKLAAAYQAEMDTLSAAMIFLVRRAQNTLSNVIGTAERAGISDELRPLVMWRERLDDLIVALESSLDKYPDRRFPAQEVKRLLAPQRIARVLTQLQSIIRTKYPEPTQEQTAWDSLTRLEENLKALTRAEAGLAAAELSQRRAKILLATFEDARDTVLGALYEQVSERFSELYRTLHGSDEATFAAKIRPDGAGLDLEVDFFGRGPHPPHALHSEGHQDSMGLCLYLALAERLTEGMIDLTILDDVIMSIDAGHRRRVCSLLASVFPNRQFLITTHDKTWATQLRAEGIVASRQCAEFSRWSVETGPVVSSETDMWQLIDHDLEECDVPTAAFRLRRGSEHFFEVVSDALGAPVRYKSNARWALGDFLPASISAYRRLLRKAKAAVQSWGDMETFGQLEELDSVASQIFGRCAVEQWAINPNVHYTSWGSFSPSDFLPLLEAFRDLYGVFQCSKCGGILYATFSGETPVSVRCNCGAVNWNLRRNR